MKELKSLNELTSTSQENPLVVVDLWAPWCGPCRRFGPIFESVSKELDQVLFVKVNIDEVREVADNLGVQSIPTVIFMKNGSEVNRYVGAPDSEASFKQLVSSAFEL